MPEPVHISTGSPLRVRNPRAARIWGALLVAVVLLGFVASCGSGPVPEDVLHNQVLAALHADVRIAPYEVQVDVTDAETGRVVLSGEVDRPEVQVLAEKLAREVDGIEIVDNQIEVRGPRSQGSKESNDASNDASNDEETS